jgi:hypothetical protein
VPLVRQRPQRLREHPQVFHANRKLAGLRLEQHSGRREDVADVVFLEGFVGVAERVALQEDLDLSGAVLQLGEARLAHDALEHHAARDVHADRVRVEPLGRLLAVFGGQQGGQHVAPEIVGEGGQACGLRRLAPRREFRAPFGDQLILVRLVVVGPALRLV